MTENVHPTPQKETPDTRRQVVTVTTPNLRFASHPHQSMPEVLLLTHESRDPRLHNRSDKKQPQDRWHIYRCGVQSNLSFYQVAKGAERR